MYNFSSLWSQFGMLTKENTFDKVFENPDLNLQALLDHEMILGEFRNQNSKLMAYMDSEIMANLVEYIITMPPEDTNEKRAFRYPFYASELLSCETPKVVDSFFPKEEQEEVEQKHDLILLEQLCSFVNDAQADVNAVLAGYFSKVFLNIFKLKPEGVIQYVFEEHQTFLDNLIKQIQSKSIADVLIKLLCIEKETILDNSYADKRKQLLESIMDRLLFEDNFEIPTNIAIIIQELVQKAYAIQDSKQMIQILITGKQFKRLCELSIHKNQYIAISASSIIYNLLHLLYQDNLRQMDTDDQSSLLLDYSETLQIYAEHLQQLLTYLSNCNEKNLGQNRLKIIETFEIILKLTQNKDIIDKFVQLDIFSILNNLLTRFEKNNIYHLHYYRIIVTIIESKQTSLIQNLFDKNDFIGLLVKITEVIDKKKKKEYLGFITKIGKFIEDVHSKQNYLSEYVDTDKWDLFRNQYFKRSLIESEIELGGLSREKVDQLDDNKDCHFHKNEIIQKYEGFFNINQDKSEAQQIQNIFETFQITDSQPQQPQTQPQTASEWSSASWDTQQVEAQDNQQQQQWDAQQSEQQPTIAVSSPIEKQTHNYAQEEIEDEYHHFWKIVHDQDILQAAMDEFEKNNF